MVVSSKNINAVYSKWTGTVEKFHKEIGKDIKKGDKLVDIKLSDGTIKTINADCDAFLDIFTIEVGMFIVEGTEIARMTPKDLPSQVIVCYVPLSSAQKFAKGMKVLIYPTAIDSQKYGHMEAEIVSIEPYATNTESLFYMLGSGNMVAEQFASNGPIVSVVCKIKNDNSTKSGYYWSSDKAQNIVVSNGNVISAKIVTEECAPITKLIGDFKDIMEG
jgi:HlyD family secretion protein